MPKRVFSGFFGLGSVNVLTSGSFPKPLDEASEAYYLEKLSQGSEEARNILVEHNLRLVVFIARKFENTGVMLEDLISIGTIGLIKAVNTFDPAKKIKLATYASRCIENEIRMHFRSAKKTEREVSLSEPIDTDGEGRPLTLMDVLAQEDTILEDLDKKMNLGRLEEYLCTCLDEREQTVLRLRYGLDGEPLAQWQGAGKLGISRSYVSRLETRALDKLRRRYERGNVGRH